MSDEFDLEWERAYIAGLTAAERDRLYWANPELTRKKEVMPNALRVSSTAGLEVHSGDHAEAGGAHPLKHAPDLRKLTLQAQHPPGSPTAARTRKKRSKYLNTPTEYGGRVYHSKKEADYARELRLRVAAGEIIYFAEQVPFRLAGGIRYVADFLEILPDWTVEIIDVKPRDWKTGKLRLTQGYRDKKKLFLEKYHLEIRER